MVGQRKFRFKQVDVFSNESCKGNPVCVFLECDGISTEEMQFIARWTNLSETTFISSSDKGDYRVRIFTPSKELPFAGHPTLGTAWAFLEYKDSNNKLLVQDCDFGLVEVRKTDKGIFFILPHYRILRDVDQEKLEDALNAKLNNDIKVIDTGPHWIVANIKNPSGTDAVSLDRSRLLKVLDETKAIGVNLYEIDGGSVNVRTFFEANGEIVEDPVCGSGNAAVAAHIKETGRISQIGKTYEAKQGKHLGRDGRIVVEIGENIMIGGRCNTVFSGEAFV